MKILPTSPTEYTIYPIFEEDMPRAVEVSEEELNQIGNTLQFDETLAKLSPSENNRAQEDVRQQRIAELRQILSSYTEDFAQSIAGVCIPDIEERKAKFREAHAELRLLEGKKPR